MTLKKSEDEDTCIEQRKINALWEALDTNLKDLFCERLMQRLALAVARGRITESYIRFIIGEACGWAKSNSLNKVFMDGFEYQLKLAKVQVDKENEEVR